MPRWGWSALIGLGVLAGCGALTGPPSITASRTFYNEAIHDTSSEQLLLNVIRAKNYEVPNFVDVSEADATVSFTSGANGGFSGIGAQPGIHSTSAGTIAGQVAGITGTFSYGDSALVRYAPVLGYPLIQQVSSPIAPQSIVRMFNSDFGLADVLEFSVDRLAPGFEDNYVAQDRMVMLDQFGAIVLASGVEPSESPSHGRGKAAGRGGANGGDAAANQNLNVILHAEALHMGRGISGPGCPFANQSPSVAVAKLWTGLRRLYRDSTSDMITLRGDASPSFFFTTRSAIGALKEAEVDVIYFTSPAEAAQIRALNNAAPCRITDNLFYFNPPPPNRTQEEVDVMWSSYLGDTLYPNIDQDIRSRAIARDTHRAFIIVEEGAGPPQNAYVAVNKRGIWYWIDNDDFVSKANFALLNEIVTIQAVPEQKQPLTPSISVGR